AAGIAVDYTRANAARAAFQIALDSTALMLSKDAAQEAQNGTLQSHATEAFNSLFSRPEVTNATVHPVYDPNGGSKLTVTGTATVNVNFLGLLGLNEINISARSESTWGNTRLRVALVLDNTGSMSDAGKITALKTASKNLLSQLQAAAVNPEDVYVSIVPFV